jgi:hypothetical protein
MHCADFPRHLGRQITRCLIAHPDGADTIELAHWAYGEVLPRYARHQRSAPLARPRRTNAIAGYQDGRLASGPPDQRSCGRPRKTSRASGDQGQWEKAAIECQAALGLGSVPSSRPLPLLNPTGVPQQKILHDELAFTSRQRSATGTAGWPAIDGFRTGFDFDDLIKRIAVRTVKSRPASRHKRPHTDVLDCWR